MKDIDFGNYLLSELIILRTYMNTITISIITIIVIMWAHYYYHMDTEGDLL